MENTKKRRRQINVDKKATVLKLDAATRLLNDIADDLEPFAVWLTPGQKRVMKAKPKYSTFFKAIDRLKDIV